MHRPTASLLLIAVVSFACGKAPRPSAQRVADDPVPAASAPTPTRPTVAFNSGSTIESARSVRFAVYLPAATSPAVIADAQRRVRAQLPDVAVQTDPAKPPVRPAVLLIAPELSAFAPPTKRQLELFGRGLDAAQSDAAVASKGVVVLTWALDADPKLDRLRKAQQIALDIAKKAGGFVWDETTRELYTPESWSKLRVGGWEGDLPDAKRHFTVHYYEAAQGRHRAITLGMGKLGLPDLVVQDVPQTQADAITTLLDVAAQLMVEGAQVGPEGKLAIDLTAIRHGAAKTEYTGTVESGATMKGFITLVTAESEEGDPDNRLAEVRFDAYPGATPVERQVAALTAILGAKSDEVTGASAKDPELEAVTKRVQAKLPTIAAAFRKGIPLGERILVKAPFDTDDKSVEWMWVSVIGWDGDVLRGHLENDPHRIKALRPGAKVEIRQDSIADYVWFKANGSREGGESMAVFERRQRETK